MGRPPSLHRGSAHTGENAAQPIDNLNFGWPTGFDPFSGRNSPVHNFPWTVQSADPPGTDRIMVISSYAGKPPAGADGYSTSTKRPDNTVQSIVLRYPPLSGGVRDAAFQIFVDDFQAPVWRAKYTVTLNGQPFPELELVVNGLSQTGPIGKLITVTVPTPLLFELEWGEVELVFDDLTSGAGDGYAIDFVKLLLNRTGVLEFGTLRGTVRDAVNNLPIAGATVTSFDQVATTATDGAYTLTNVPAGLAVVSAQATGYTRSSRNADVVHGETTLGVDLLLTRAPTQLSIYPAVELEFFTIAGAAYQLQFSADLSTWENDERVPGTGQWVTRLRSTRPATHRYWRVVGP